MARVTVEDCIDKVDNRFELVLLASHRARLISSGSPLTIDRDRDKNPVVALREIADETIAPDDLKEQLIHSMQKYVEVDEPEAETVPLLGNTAAAATARNDSDTDVTFDRMSEEDLLRGLEGLVPPSQQRGRRRARISAVDFSVSKSPARCRAFLHSGPARPKSLAVCSVPQYPFNFSPLKAREGDCRRMMRQYELVERVKRYNPSTDEALLNRAYMYAMMAHGNQKRASGDLFFGHPLEVAAILTDLKLDEATIAAAVLHDTVEDTEATLEEINKSFGRQIGALVDGLTKIKRLDLVSKRAAQGENFRKLLLAIADDVRVLLVKLADRLHNMRTLQFMPAEKRQRIAEETLDIYAPLAGRMGIQEMREELEDLSFQNLDPEAYGAISRHLQEVTAKSEKLVEEIEQTLTAQARSPGHQRRGDGPPEAALFDLAQDGAQIRSRSSSFPTFSGSGSSSRPWTNATGRSASSIPAGR